MGKFTDNFILFEKTNTYHNLLHYWNDENYHLNGIDKELNYTESIKRDEAVDDETGKAYYDEYVFYTDEEEYVDPAKRFTKEDMERFVKTW